MRVLQFLKKEFIQAFRNPITILLMMLFPLLLTWFLGNALSGVSKREITLPDLSFPIVTEAEENFEQMRELADEMGIELNRVTREEALEKIRNKDALGYIELGEEELTFYRVDEEIRKKSPFESYLSENMLYMFSKVYVQQVDVALDAIKQEEYDLLEMFDDPQVEVTLSEVEGKSAPGSFDYYGVVMLTLIMMYASIQSMAQLESEYEYQTMPRIKISTLSPNTLFFAKSVGSILLALLQAVVVILINRFLFQINYGNVLVLLAYMLPFIVFVCSLGIFSLLLTKDGKTAVTLLNIVIPFFLFLGGAYITIPKEGFLASMAKISPVYWLNQGIFDLIYSGDAYKANVSVLINLGVAIVLTAASYILFMREKGVSFGRNN